MFSGHREIDFCVLAFLTSAMLGGAVLAYLRHEIGDLTLILIGSALLLGFYSWAIPPLLRRSFLRILVVLPPFLLLGVIGGIVVWEYVPDAARDKVYPALVTGSVIVLGWFVTFLFSSYAEAQKFHLQRRDTLIALRNEIFALVDKLDNQPIAAHAEKVQKRILSGDGTDAKGNPIEYFPFSTMESEPIVFEAISSSIPALGEDTVASVVRFYAEYTDLRRMVEDSRNEQTQKLSRERRVAFHQQLTNRRTSTLRWGLSALVAINIEMGHENPEGINRSGENEDVNP